MPPPATPPPRLEPHRHRAVPDRAEHRAEGVQREQHPAPPAPPPVGVGHRTASSRRPPPCPPAPPAATPTGRRATSDQCAGPDVDTGPGPRRRGEQEQRRPSSQHGCQPQAMAAARCGARGTSSGPTMKISSWLAASSPSAASSRSWLRVASSVPGDQPFLAGPPFLADQPFLPSAAPSVLADQRGHSARRHGSSGGWPVRPPRRKQGSGRTPGHREQQVSQLDTIAEAAIRGLPAPVDQLASTVRRAPATRTRDHSPTRSYPSHARSSRLIASRPPPAGCGRRCWRPAVGDVGWRRIASDCIERGSPPSRRVTVMAVRSRVRRGGTVTSAFVQSCRGAACLRVARRVARRRTTNREDDPEWGGSMRVAASRSAEHVRDQPSALGAGECRRRRSRWRSR